MHRKLLVVLDSTPASRAAVLEAIGLAMLSDSALHFYHVMPGFVPPMSDPASGMIWGLDDHMKAVHKTAGALTKAALRDAAVAGVVATAHAEFDDEPAEAILNEARKKGCDLIVIGSQGRSTLQRLMFGSVVTRLLTLSPLPILACKQGKSLRATRVAVTRKRDDDRAAVPAVSAVPTARRAGPSRARKPARATRRGG